MTQPQAIDEWFIDRDSYLSDFQNRVLDAGGVFVLYGEAGVGKSALLQRLRNAAAVDGTIVASARFGKFKVFDAISLIDEVVRQLDHDAFKAARDSVDRLLNLSIPVVLSMPASPSSITVGAGSAYYKSQIGEMIGQQINISNLPLDWEAAKTRRTQHLNEVSSAFLQGLCRATKDTKIVLIFDEIHQAAEEAKSWIWDELVEGKNRLKLGNAVFILTYGADRPQIDGQFSHVALVRNLTPLSETDTTKLIRNRAPEMDEAGAKVLAQMALAHFKGNLKSLFPMIDAWVAYNEEN